MVDEPHGASGDQALLFEKFDDVVQSLDHVEDVHFLVDTLLTALIEMFHNLPLSPAVNLVQTRQLEMEQQQKFVGGCQAYAVVVAYLIREISSFKVLWDIILDQVLLLPICLRIGWLSKDVVVLGLCKVEPRHNGQKVEML